MTTVKDLIEVLKQPPDQDAYVVTNAYGGDMSECCVVDLQDTKLQSYGASLVNVRDGSIAGDWKTKNDFLDEQEGPQNQGPGEFKRVQHKAKSIGRRQMTIRSLKQNRKNANAISTHCAQPSCS